MCGISALIGGSANAEPRRIVAMSDLVRYRGPDDEGYLLLSGADLVPQLFARQAPPPASGARVLLGHRRLSIVDLSAAGHQPMSTPDGGVWITYNGEVYNHLELRRELEALGHAFVSQSDTEVMLAAYRQWGMDCLARFNGMFAFVLVDRARRRAYAVRDRFGVKPLYWLRLPDGTLAFGSEIKQFTALAGWRPRINGQRAYDFLVWGASEHTSETMFDGVRQLRGGELAEIDLETDHTPRISRWYELLAQPFGGSREAAAAEFRELLTDSVKLRLRADVPVGSCLSGGLDSSSIVCLANGLLRERGGETMQKTFSAVSDAPRYDERRYAQDVVRETGASASMVAPQPKGFFDLLDTMVWHQDEPFGSTSIYAQWEVFRIAAESGVKVMLDGQGADEAIGGYPVFRGARLAGLARSLQFGALAREIAALRRVQGVPALSLFYQLSASLLPAPLVALGRRWAGDQAEPAWLDLERLGARPVHPYASEEVPPRRSMQQLSRSQLLSSSLPLLLHWEDRDSMAHSIEARVPFLDYRLVEFALGLPDEFKLGGGNAKLVLRDAMVGIIPETVRRRSDKLGFQMPDEDWLRAEAPRYRAALAAAIEASDGIVRPRAVETLEQMIAGRRPLSYGPLAMICFAAWMQRFEVCA